MYLNTHTYYSLRYGTLAPRELLGQLQTIEEDLLIQITSGRSRHGQEKVQEAIAVSAALLSTVTASGAALEMQ